MSWNSAIASPEVYPRAGGALTSYGFLTVMAEGASDARDQALAPVRKGPPIPWSAPLPMPVLPGLFFSRAANFPGGGGVQQRPNRWPGHAGTGAGERVLPGVE